MIKRFKLGLRTEVALSKTPEESTSQFLFQNRESKGIPKTGYILTDDGSQCFTIYPRYDLICIRPLRYMNGKFVEWDFGHATGIWNIPLFSMNQDFTSTKNLALEFKPEWVQDKDWATSHWFWRMTDILREDMAHIDKIWFIDYRIHLELDDSESSLRGFYSDNQVFIPGSFWSDSYTAGSPCKDIIEFVETVEAAVEIPPESQCCSYCGIDSCDGHRTPDFGILTCESLNCCGGSK
ncbi:hypothetical protein F4805DRAFT_418733 [Annulohypoxylon moriforme]|nr:hypothetical protein F4805DRAFT_418733 [Annulohypoxylon moriforme]